MIGIGWITIINVTHYLCQYKETHCVKNRNTAFLIGLLATSYFKQSFCVVATWWRMWFMCRNDIGYHTWIKVIVDVRFSQSLWDYLLHFKITIIIMLIRVIYYLWGFSKLLSYELKLIPKLTDFFVHWYCWNVFKGLTKLI